MNASVLFGALICTCSSAAQKWTRLSENLKLTVAGYSSRSDWALTLGHLALIGAFSKYPMLAAKVVCDLDFGRRLQCFSDQDLQGLTTGIKKNLRLCVRNFENFDKKRKQRQRAELQNRKREEFRKRKQEVASCVAKRAAMALSMVLALDLNRSAGLTRPVELPSTCVGFTAYVVWQVPNLCGTPGGAAATSILNLSEVQPPRLSGAAATLILNLNGGQEAQPPRLSST
ncbi:unnamed protein product [Symbiodinium sp. KB8]|nr:unnamed protein product [Symbiodinium sp. KB8]